jgi:hypothetical protein
MSSVEGWRVYFGDMSIEPTCWYRFGSIRRLLQYPRDEKLPFAQMFEFIKENWNEIVDRFSPARRAETHRRLDEFESSA